MPGQDRRGHQGRVGPFVTFVERVRPNGVVARWESRDHRKHPQGAPATGSTWWAPRARGWWIAVLFAAGSLLFALGAVPGYASAVGTRWDAVTFFVGFQYLFNWQWPSMLYGVDIVAWDIFFALALLFAAPVFHASRHVAVRNGMLIAAALSVVGLVGPALNHIALRQIGIVGYAIVWPIVCLPLSRAFG